MDISSPIIVKYPDVSAMRLMQGEISKFVNVKAKHLSSSIRENVSDLLRLLRECDAQMKDQVLSATLNLAHQNWSEINAAAVSSQNGQNQGISKDIEDELVRLRGRLKASLQVLSQRVSAIQVYRLSELEERRSQLAGTKERMQASVDHLLEVVAGMERQKNELDQIITTFEVPTLFSIIKGMIPTEEEVDLLLSSIKNPTVTPELVKAAVKKFEANLDVIGEGRKFSDLVSARATCVGQIAEQRQALSSLQSLLQQAVQEHDELVTAGNVDSWRDRWVLEAQKLTTTWQSHQAAAQQATELGTLGNALMALSVYLAEVRRNFETV